MSKNLQRVTVYVRKIHVALFLCAEKALLNFCDMIYQTADLTSRLAAKLERTIEND